MTYHLRIKANPYVTPTLERWLTREAAELGRQYWERVTGMELEVYGATI